MRLTILRRGHNKRNRLALRLMRAVGGTEPDDVIKTSLYRPAFFGRAWVDLLRTVMRGPSDWTPGERELFAAVVSRLNACPFCAGIHTITTTLMLDSTVSPAALDNWKDEDFEPRIAATLALLEKVALSPGAVSGEDIARVRAAGVTEEAVVDALHVCFLFCLVNRLANALDFDYGTEAEALKVATVLKRVNYNLPGFLLR